MKKQIIFAALVLFFSFISYAADDFKPYLHNPSTPEHPDIRLYGQYNTLLFPGSAAYSYPIDVPKGTNGLIPSVSLSYSSQSNNDGLLGKGWSISSDYIYRDVNSTPAEVSDDGFILVLDGSNYQLIPNNGEYKTEVDYHFRIEYLSGGNNDYSHHWLLTKKDGRKYRFGYNEESELVSNTGKNYSVKWYLDLVEDTHSNSIHYNYTEDEADGFSSLNEITYNNDRQRRISFTYSDRLPDEKYEEGNLLILDKKLTDVSVYVTDELVRKYSVSYISLNDAFESVSGITQYGSDGTTLQHAVSFSYHVPAEGYRKDSSVLKSPVLFSSSSTDYGVRLIDVNNDGYSDIVKRDDSENKVWINNKVNWTLSTWTVPEKIVSSNLDNGVRFADVNNDGFIDLIRSIAGSTRKVYLNNGTQWKDSSISFPLDIVDASSVDQGIVLEDINNDGKIDVLKAKSGSRSVYLNNGNGWSLGSYAIPVDFLDASGDTGVRVVDINSDGLPDIVQGTAGVKRTWLNNGTGWFETSRFISPIEFVDTSRDDTGARLLDVDLDGYIDIIKQETSVWLNNGTGFVSSTQWNSPEKFIDSGFNGGRRIADINGDGFSDIVVSISGSQYSWVKNATTPYLLRSITNEYGGKTNITYTKSTQFDNAENGISGLGFNLYVVRNVTANNGLTGNFLVSSGIRYNYSQGKYNYQNSEFRGFGKTTEIYPSKIIKHYFLQDDPRRSKEYKIELFDSNWDLYSRNEMAYVVVNDSGIYNVSLKSEASYLYDGMPEPVVTNKSYTYDWYGNLKSVFDQGDIYIDGDERYFNYTYGFNKADWIMDRVAISQIYDSDGEKVGETKYYYDSLGLKGVGEKGELTKTEQWNSNGENTVAFFDYDDFGNIKKQTDSLGNSQRYNYDSTFTYPISTINALGHITYFDYDPGTGNLNWQEKNGIKIYYYYDIHGRIAKEVMPYDSYSLPTKEYGYVFDGTAPESVRIRLKTTSNNTNTISYYYDGFANLVQLKTVAENGQEIVKNIFYDDEYRVEKEQNPYYATYNEELSSVSADEDYTFYTYDAMDRVTQVTNPDGTKKNVTFERYNITSYDEDGNKHKYELDASGRIAKVYEYNTNGVGIDETYTTKYRYDAKDNLILIIDEKGNEFSFSYDSLGRKISMEDPDLGHWTYSYDKNGNLITQTDSRNKTITLSYDALNRIKLKESDDITINFAYDGEYYGTLSNITTGNEFFEYDYDDRLRVTKETQEAIGQIVQTEYIYDSQDRLISQIGLSELDYFFDKSGHVRKIPGYIQDSAYNAFGSIINRSYGNGLVQQFEYDEENNRLRNILIADVQNLTYGYDNVGNIVSIYDAEQNRNHLLAYDNLNRLVEATIGIDNYRYSYNPLGNMMKIVHNNEGKIFSYAGEQAHAPSKIATRNNGVDVYNPSMLETGLRKRIFEFWLYHDTNETTTTELDMDFGDGNTFSNSSMAISGTTWAFVENNYTNGGEYTVNISSTDDEELLNIDFGMYADAIDYISNNLTRKTIQLELRNDLQLPLTNILVNCSGTTTTVNLSSQEIKTVNITLTYITPGTKEVSCKVTSNDGDEILSKTFTMPGIEVESYDTLYSNISRKIITYAIGNNFLASEVNFSMGYDGELFGDNVALGSDEEMMMFIETNYSSPGTNEFEINYSTIGQNDNYVDSFILKGVEIENYTRSNTYSNYSIRFNLVNYWYSGIVDWNISDPMLENESTVNGNKNILIENTYSQGLKKPSIMTYLLGYTSLVKDYFEVKPLKVESYSILEESQDSTVSELFISNSQANNQTFTWKIDTGQRNITNTTQVADDILIYIESNYTTEGVYSTSVRINSSTYSDTEEKGVVIG